MIYSTIFYFGKHGFIKLIHI